MTDPIDAHLAESRQHLMAGNLGHADAILRTMIHVGRAHPEAWAQLALLARLVKEDQTAFRFAQMALQLQPAHAQARSILAATKGAAPSLDAKSSPDKRYLLIRAWNAGFWSDVDHVLGSLLLASLTNRTPVIHWGPDSRYGGTAEASAWDHFFEPVSGVTVHDLAGAGLSCHPPKWNHGNIAGQSINRFTGKHSRTSFLSLLNRPEPVVVTDYFTALSGVRFYLRPDHADFKIDPQALMRRMLAERVRPLEKHRAAAEAFAKEHFTRRPVLAVHVRGTDKIEEDPDVGGWNNRLAGLADQALTSGQVKSVFLMTDTAAAQEGWKKHFKDALICPPSQVADGPVGLHFTPELDGITLGREILVDSLIATHADRFAGLASSNVARMISYLRPWPEGALHLAGEDLLSLPNTLLFDPRNSFGERN